MRKKNRKYLLLIMLILIINVSVLFILLPNKNKISITLRYYMNKNEINNLKSLISTDKYLMIRKENSKYEIKTIDEHNYYSVNQLSDHFSDIVKKMEKLNLVIVEKDADDIILTCTAKFNFAQSIIYTVDIQKYIGEHVVLYKKRLDNNWYYIEEK